MLSLFDSTTRVPLVGEEGRRFAKLLENHKHGSSKPLPHSGLALMCGNQCALHSKKRVAHCSSELSPLAPLVSNERHKGKPHTAPVPAGYSRYGTKVLCEEFRTLLVAPGLTSNKKLLGAPDIATIGAPGRTTRSK